MAIAQVTNSGLGPWQFVTGIHSLTKYTVKLAHAVTPI